MKEEREQNCRKKGRENAREGIKERRERSEGIEEMKRAEMEEGWGERRKERKTIGCSEGVCKEIRWEGESVSV